MSGGLLRSADGDHVTGCVSAHVVAVVAAPGVVVDEPAVGFGLELAGAGEAATVEGGPPALLEDGAVEPFAHRVVVRRPGWDPVVIEALGGDGGGERVGLVLGPVVGEHGPHAQTHAPIAAEDLGD